MKVNKFVLIAFSLFFCGYLLAQKKKSKAPNQQQLVNSAFENYRMALTNGNGFEAVKYVDQSTINYFNNILGWIKNADSTQIAQTRIFDKLMILVIRHKATKEEVQSFDGAGLLAYCISNGLIGKPPIAGSTITNIKVADKTATAQIVVMSKPQNFYLQFFEEKNWKIDLAAIFTDSNTKLQSIATEQHKTETELVLHIIEKNLKKPVTREIWKPIK
mgnify:CR=1 FL=1